MHKNATKCNKTLSKWCKNKHGASKIINTFETYQPSRSRVDDDGGVQYVSWKLIGCLGFPRRGEYIGGRAASGGGPGGHTTWWRGQGLGRATPWCAWPLVSLRRCFGLRLVSGKIRTLAFVSFNSENISCVAFLTHKQKIGNWHCGISLIS
jgi:hypothetical protein